MQQEPGVGGGVVEPRPVPRVVWRLRVVAICAALTALAFLQDPGLTAIDTKVDLVENPLGWLARALQIWDPAGTFGQLQNQAYGYLWPMGPFFLLGDLIGLPAWVVQRLWWALVMIVSFTGVVRLSGKLGIGTPWARLIAGVAFALSPRILTELGPISVEAWPSAVAPWVLVPLVGLAHGAAIRPAVTRSAIAVACAGGVNATAVFAVVPLAGLWLLSLQPMRRRLQALLAWGVAVLCATAWWLVPLFVLGRYSPPFLDYIETAASTTAPTDLVSVLRGASHWHAYLSGPYDAPWSAGWELATSKALIAATVVVAALGLAGLSRRGLPHRRFLVTGLLVGLAMVGFGYTGAVSGLFSEQLHAFLDGAGAPLRNVHKFDVVLRLPLALGLAYLLGLLGRAATVADSEPGRTPAARWAHPARLRAGLVTGTALVAVGVVATPALAGGLAAQGSYHNVPGYWQEASSWLDDNLENEHVLVVPAARFPRYLWGSPSDEITQPLLESRWGVRSSIPLTPPATIRLLDSIDAALSSGTGSPGLADVLARSGIKYLLLRSDLDYGKSGAVAPMIARQALERSPGIRRVTGFGPVIGGGKLPGVFSDKGFNVEVQALEVWGVTPQARAVTAYDAAALTTVVGGPESMMSLAAAGQLPAGPTVLVGDRPEGLPDGPVALTDGLRRREVSFGLLRDNASATLTAEEEGWLNAPARDYLPEWGDEQTTDARYLGVRAIRASSAWSEAEPMAGARPAHLPYAAVDGDAETSWRSAPGTLSVGQWLEVELAEPEEIEEVVIAFDRGTDSIPTAFTVTTDREQVRVTEIDQSSETVAVTLTEAAPIQRLRITVDAVNDVRMGFGGVGITELVVGDVRARRTLVVPPSPIVNRAASVVLEAAPARPACYFADGRPVCSGELARHSEDAGRIDRTLELPGAAQYQVRMWARPVPGGPLNALLDPNGRAAVTRGIVPTVVASSEEVPEPAARAGAAVDGDPETTWYAAEGDAHPWLKLNWLTPQRIDGVRLHLAEDAAAARPVAVTVLSDQGSRSGLLDDGGSFVFDEPLQATSITVLITEKQAAISHDPYVNRPEGLPVGVSELSTLPAGRVQRADLDDPVRLPCGTGPTVDVDGERRTTGLVASRRDLLELREVEVVLCGADAGRPVPATSGEIRVVAEASTFAEPTRLALLPRGRDAATTDAAAERPVEVTHWESTLRRLTLQPGAGGQIVVLRENVNAGWEATGDGVRLTPVTVDGWQQGWLVPAGVTEVEIRFGPAQTYGTALTGGAALLAGTALLAVFPGRSGAAAVAPPARRRRPVAALVFGGIALLTVGGLTAAGMVLLAAAVFVVFAAVAPYLGEEDRRQLRQGLRAAGNWLPAGLVLVAGWLAVRVDDFPDRWAQLAALAAATGLWLSVVAGRRRRGTRSFHLWKGRSTR